MAANQLTPRSSAPARRRKRCALFLAAVFAAVGACRSEPPPPQNPRSARPNILLISLCSVRADHMSLYGYRRRTTPNFEALAGRAIVFEHAAAQWPKTAPSFASIMTGNYGHTTGVMRITPQQHLADEHETLAEVLRAHGYDTGAFLSTAAVNTQTNIPQGFDTVEEVYRLPHKEYEATKRALAWLQSRGKRPFFAWVHYNNAHVPYRAPGADPAMFVDDPFYDATRRLKLNRSQTLPLNVPDDHPFRRQILRADIGGVYPGFVLIERPDELDFYIARYDAGIFGADWMAGNLLGAVRKMGLLENTIVALVGDHGESLGEHNYYFEHGRLPYDDCARVPLLIRPAGGTDPRRISVPVPVFGLAPTLLEMVGIAAPKAMEAESLLPLVRGAREPGYVLTESGYQLDYTLSVRDAVWKLIHVPNKIDRALMTGSEYELYNLQADPGELHNVHDSEPEVAARLRRVLEAWSEPWLEAAYGGGRVEEYELDEQTFRELRSLGYVD